MGALGSGTSVSLPMFSGRKELEYAVQVKRWDSRSAPTMSALQIVPHSELLVTGIRESSPSILIANRSAINKQRWVVR
jgi:hypothetical protein